MLHQSMHAQQITTIYFCGLSPSICQWMTHCIRLNANCFLVQFQCTNHFRISKCLYWYFSANAWTQSVSFWHPLVLFLCKIVSISQTLRRDFGQQFRFMQNTFRDLQLYSYCIHLTASTFQTDFNSQIQITASTFSIANGSVSTVLSSN